MPEISENSASWTDSITFTVICFDRLDHSQPALITHGLTVSTVWHRKCNNIAAMKDIVLCSSNPILIKSLYCVLREEGFNVEIVEHPSLAVQKVLFGKYDFVIVDSEPFGLSAEDAVEIIKAVSPDTPTVVVGGGMGADVPSVETPVDLEEFKHTIHSITV
jgi:hypothetical protein